MDDIFYTHMPSLFEYKHAGEVTKCRSPTETLYSLALVCVSWMLAWLLAPSGDGGL